MEQTRSSYQRTYHLVQQSPLIHFQYYEHKAALRASEVKSKLDRFLTELLGGKDAVRKNHLDWLGKFSRSNIANAGVFSYDYKMQITANKPITRTITTETGLYHLMDDTKKVQQIQGYFFENRPEGKTRLDKKISVIKTYKEAVRYKEGLNLTITCFIPELLAVIDGYLAMFFVLYGFGARKAMGFGSFLVENTDVKKELIRMKRLINHPFFYIETPAGNPLQQLMEIETIFRLLKGGINLITGDYFKGFIFRYFLEQGIGNEKSFAKQDENMLGSLYQNGEKRQEKQEEYRFIRAMLGLSSFYQHPAYGEKIVLWETNGEIEKFASPTRFKIAENYILLFPEPIPETLFDRSFTFRSAYGSAELRTPTKEQFDFMEFLRAFAKDFNDKEGTKGGKTSLSTAKSSLFQRIKREDYIIREGTELE